MAKAKAVVKRKRRKPPAKRNGRPTKLTQPVADRIIEGVIPRHDVQGMPRWRAAIHEDTLDSWRKRGAAESNTTYTRFLGQTRQGSRKDRHRPISKRFGSRSWRARLSVREHIKQDENGKVIMKEIHKRNAAPGHQGRDVVA